MFYLPNITCLSTGKEFQKIIIALSHSKVGHLWFMISWQCLSNLIFHLSSQWTIFILLSSCWLIQSCFKVGTIHFIKRRFSPKSDQGYDSIFPGESQPVSFQPAVLTLHSFLCLDLDVIVTTFCLHLIFRSGQYCFAADQWATCPVTNQIYS